jgi:hypothetical protein
MTVIKARFEPPDADADDHFCHLAAAPNGEPLCGSSTRHHEGESGRESYENPPDTCPTCERPACPDCLERWDGLKLAVAEADFNLERRRRMLAGKPTAPKGSPASRFFWRTS